MLYHCSRLCEDTWQLFWNIFAVRSLAKRIIIYSLSKGAVFVNGSLFLPVFFFNKDIALLTMKVWFKVFWDAMFAKSKFKGTHNTTSREFGQLQSFFVHILYDDYIFQSQNWTTKMNTSFYLWSMKYRVVFYGCVYLILTLLR